MLTQDGLGAAALSISSVRPTVQQTDFILDTKNESAHSVSERGRQWRHTMHALNEISTRGGPNPGNRDPGVLTLFLTHDLDP